MAKTICTILGIGLLLVGLLGFVSGDFLGTHLSTTHSAVHLLTGAISLFLGLKGSLGAARMFCIVFGSVYALLGVGGFVLGAAASPSAGVPGPQVARLWRVIPGMLELGTMDHVIHILLGGIFLIGGVVTRSVAAVEARR